MIWTIVAAFLWWWAAFTIKIIEDAHWADKSVPSKSLFLYLAWPLLPFCFMEQSGMRTGKIMNEEEIPWREATPEQEEPWIKDSAKLFRMMADMVTDVKLYGVVVIPTEDAGLVMFVPKSMEPVLQSILDELGGIEIRILTPPTEH